MHPEDVEEMEQFFGRRAESRDWNRPDIDWDAIDSQLVSKRIIITNSKVNGAKLGALRLRNQYGINITPYRPCWYRDPRSRPTYTCSSVTASRW